MDYTVKKANEAIAANRAKVNQQYRQKYHMMPPCGWMNDPNGLVKFRETYHLFYQFYPYKAWWGAMHWGHFVSQDLIRYEDVSVAMAPDAPEESGCFSGGAIVAEDKLNLLYTRHYEVEGFKSEKQYLAASGDGMTFVKSETPVFDNTTLPAHISQVDFRDPNPAYINGSYYVFVGGKTEENKGVIVVLKGDSLTHFAYDFTIGPIYELGEMGECPSYFRIEDMDCFLVSGVNVEPKGNDYINRTHASVILAGKLDLEKKAMDITHIQELDKGDTFYAPQIIANEKEAIFIGWLEMWCKTYPTYEWGHGWIGGFSIPRVLSLRGGRFYQSPIPALSNYYKKSYLYTGGPVSRVSDVTVKAVGAFRLTFRASNGSFTVGQDETGVYLDGRDANNLNQTFRRTNDHYENPELRILLDTSSVEIFVNDGAEVISSRIYLDSDYDLELDGTVNSILVNEIEVG